MLAELAVFTTAAKTVAKCIQAGRELSTVATSIGKMAESKDALQTKLSKKKNRTFSTVETEFEEASCQYRHSMNLYQLYSHIPWNWSQLSPIRRFPHTYARN